MTICSSDNNRYVDIGSYTIWHSLYSTVAVRLKEYHDLFPDAINFLRTGKCDPQNAQKTARQINLLRDRLASISPDNAVYDLNHLSMEPPWKGHISPIVTSCANLYTTADGKDLLFELVSTLCHAYTANVAVKILE